MKRSQRNSHSLAMGYILWLFGFMGAHRFYYGRRVTGVIYLFTFGLLGVGWFIDLFLIPGMDKTADATYVPGPIDYNVAWILLTFLGIFGIHRFYLGKWLSGLLFLCTGGFFVVGVLYDFLTLNQQIDTIHRGSV